MPDSRPRRHVALIVETSNAYARGLLTGIRQFAIERPNWSIYLAEHSRRETDLSWLDGWRGHGIIARVETEETAALIRKLDLPAVDLSAKGLLAEAPCVETDDAVISNWAVEHFVERGIRSVAYCGDERFGWSIVRGAAFKEHASALGLESFEFALRPSGDRSADRETLARWVNSLPSPVGVLACYDIAGQEVIEACKLTGRRVPDQVAVLGVDNDELFCNLTSPPLSSIEPDSQRTGFIAAGLLDRMMAGRQEDAGVRAVPPLRVATRQSTDILFVDDPLVSAATTYISNNAHHSVPVSAILRHVGLSRRALDHRFVKLIGRTVHAHILRVRMSRVADLLTSTDWTLFHISEHLDFKHAEYMSVMFKREFGVSPGEYRKRLRGNSEGAER